MEPKAGFAWYLTINLLACALVVAAFAILIFSPLQFEQSIPIFWMTLFLSILLAIGSVRLLAPDERRRRWWEPAVSLALIGGACIFFAPILAPQKNMSKPTCLSNVRTLGVAVQIYASDYDERLPIAQGWKDRLLPYVKNEAIFGPCPSSSSPYTYALSESVSAARVASIEDPARTVLLFECASQVPSPVGNSRHFMKRHENRGAVAFVDSRAKMIKNKAGDAIWTR